MLTNSLSMRRVSVSAAKARDSVCFRSQCVSTQTAAVIDIQRIPSLEARSNSLDATRPLTYVGSVGPPMKVRVGFLLKCCRNVFFTRLNLVLVCGG